MNNKITYIGYYDTLSNSHEDRYTCLAATNKMNYILSALNRNGYDVEIVSPSWTRKKKYFPGSTVSINEKTRLKLFPALPVGNKIQNAIKLLLNRICVFLYLFFSIKKGEQVIVYHSLALMNTIFLLKKLKTFVLILEVEEIYSDVGLTCRHLKKRELHFFHLAEKYIFPTELLNEKLNPQGQPHVIIYGTYHVEYTSNIRINDGRIHVVYAGTFDPRKGGAAAAAAAEYLDERYHVHIIGFGSEMDKKALLDTIEHIAKKTKCKLTYDGLKSGEDYIRFIQSCDIGLSTQNPDAAFNNTSFPSKILSYMANGLRVVSIRIPAIEGSAIGQYMYYYDEQTAEEIAKAIMAVDMWDAYDSRTIIKELDGEFAKQIGGLVSGL